MSKGVKIPDIIAMGLVREIKVFEEKIDDERSLYLIKNLEGFELNP